MLADLYGRLVKDSWRTENGFTVEMEVATRELFAANTDEDRAVILGNWLERFQPCLFGRVAARKGLVSYCFLTEEDLLSPDLTIRTKIQQARTLWTRLGYEGKRSAFVLLAISDRLVSAVPDENLMEFTKHLASLFLLQDIEQDQIYMDEIFLEMPGPSRTTWRWNVGINYFGISGDKRWWQDHRIPGGLGFSTNSVGHLVKSGQIAEKMTELQDLLGEVGEEFVSTKVSSLPTALEWAMRTIHNASTGPSGKATKLVPREEASTSPVCPIHLPKFLEDRNHCAYLGWYHTDITIPTEYFVADVERPATLTSHELDFTYLFNQELSNPDYVTTATGRRVRDFDSGLPGPEKTSRADSTIELIADQPRLVNALVLSMPTQSMHSKPE